MPAAKQQRQPHTFIPEAGSCICLFITLENLAKPDAWTATLEQPREHSKAGPPQEQLQLKALQNVAAAAAAAASRASLGLSSFTLHSGNGKGQGLSSPFLQFLCNSTPFDLSTVNHLTYRNDGLVASVEAPQPQPTGTPVLGQTEHHMLQE